MDTIFYPDCGKVTVTLVELIAWVYRDQRAHEMSHITLNLSDLSNGDSEYHRLSRDGCAQLLQDRKLGANIPSTLSQQRLVLHPDAEVIHRHLCDISHSDPYGAILIFRHGRHGMIPDYCQEVPQPQPVYGIDKHGRERIVDSVCRVTVIWSRERKSIPKAGKNVSSGSRSAIPIARSPIGRRWPASPPLGWITGCGSTPCATCTAACRR